MRTSVAALALIGRRRGGHVEYLCQWNPDWDAFHFIGGHKSEGESFRACAAREIGEELRLLPDDYSMGANPVAHLEYIALSRRAGVETAYTIELFEVEPRGDKAVEAIERCPENAWLSTAEIAAGLADDGRAISPTMRLLLGKTGRLAMERRPSVFSVGVIGHRDLRRDDYEGLSERLSELFDVAEAAVGARPIEVLSPLAAGADQLFAEVALARGYRLIAPLPLPLDLYCRDFDRESGGAFRRLLLRATEWYSLPLSIAADDDAECSGRMDTVHQAPNGGQRPPCASTVSREQVAVAGLARDLMYEAVGRHVVDRCDLLVALWDGNQNGQRGGTGEMVAFARCAAADQVLRVEVVPVRREGG